MNETYFNRFDFEQAIMACWSVTDDVALLAKRGAAPEEFTALAKLYQHKFEELFDQFEQGVTQRKILWLHLNTGILKIKTLLRGV